MATPLFTRGEHLDFLVAFDEHITASSLGFVIYGHEMHQIAQAAGLIGPGDQSATRWTGELVQMGYATHGPLSAGDPRPLPRGGWTDFDLQRVSDYRITYEGRSEADRVRRQRREALTEAALGVAFKGALDAVSGEQRRAVATPFAHLRPALDNEQPVSAVGAAKDLVEASCKVGITAAGGTFPARASLPGLVKEALRLKGLDDPADELARSLTATVQRLDELRNVLGAGHGRAAQPKVSPGAARLAASAASGIAAFVLGGA